MKKTKVKDNTIYCVYCGQENKIESKKCSKCEKELNPKNRPFRDYIQKKVEDKLGGKVQDSMFALISGFIKTHLYGTVLTCSIIISAVSFVVNVINNSNEFEVVKERPVVTQKLKYAGEGLTSKEVVIAYVDALNDGKLDEAKLYELNTFYPDIFNNLIDKNAYEGNGVFLSNNELLNNRESIFKEKESYQEAWAPGLVLNSKYDDYSFVRHAIYFNYCHLHNCDEEDNKFKIVIDVEVILIDGNYYVSGTEKEVPMSIDQDLDYQFLLKYKGDVDKFTQQDIDTYIDENYS